MMAMGIYEFVQISQYLTIPVLFYFLFLFYKNYKNISSIDNTKKLMTKIKKTRRTVRNYVIFNLLYIVYIAAIMTFGMVRTPQGNFQNIPEWLIVLIMILVTVIMLLLFWGFYQLLYGILLNKLNRNYTELAKLDQKE
jgi:protein-S-isoprenylcysteine O-methyltransferase Ste14